ncbi:hypothetical protein M1437_01140 [Patescibacteria group bacterium]|nr:hypothetical protein [Patescibacteria group bacterium]
MSQKGFAPLQFLIGILIIGVVISGVYYFKPSIFSPITKNSPRACTQEAKQCPDGSSVGRTDPNCEFSPCPSPKSSDEIVTWKEYKTAYYAVNYPDNWQTGVPDIDASQSNLDHVYFYNSNDPYILGISVYGQSSWENKKNTFGLTINSKAGTKENDFKGVKGFRREGYFGENGNNYGFVMLINSGNAVYVISAYQKTDKGDYTKDIDRILSTFKFLDKEGQDAGTEDWLTYENTKYNYSFKYPKLFFISSGGFGKLGEEVAKKLDEVNLIERSLFANESNQVYIKVAVTNNNTCTSDIECAQAMKKKIGILNDKQKLITIDGQEIHGFGYQTKGPDGKTYNGNHEYFIFPRNGKVWDIYFYYSLTDLSEEEIRDYYSTFEKIMASFSIH